MSLSLAKEHCRIDSSDGSQDNVLAIYIKTAIRVVEAATGRALIQRQFRMLLDHRPCDDILDFPVSPLVSLDSFKYFDDTSNAYVTWPSSNYTVETTREPGYLRLGLGVIWPIPKFNIVDRFQLDFTAGYGLNDTDVPEGLRSVILLLVSQQYENREPIVVGLSATELPKTFDFLLSPFKVWDV